MSSKQIAKVSAGLIIISLATLLIAQTAAAPSSGQCPGLGYQSDKCECAKGEKHQPCPCRSCSANQQCSCIVAARESAGTITGTVKLFKAIAKTTGPKSYKDVVVYLEKVGNNNFPPPIKPAVVDQKGMVFIPHVLAVQKGRPVVFQNSDNDKHNVYFLYETKGKTVTKDLGTWMPGESRSHTFKESKELIALCKLHLEMAAYVVVLDNPFFTMTSINPQTRQASFTIKNVPPGEYVLKTWHKKLKLRNGSQKVTVQAGQATNVQLTITKPKYVLKK